MVKGVTCLAQRLGCLLLLLHRTPALRYLHNLHGGKQSNSNKAQVRSKETQMKLQNKTNREARWSGGGPRSLLEEVRSFRREDQRAWRKVQELVGCAWERKWGKRWKRNGCSGSYSLGYEISKGTRVQGLVRGRTKTRQGTGKKRKRGTPMGGCI